MVRKNLSHIDLGSVAKRFVDGGKTIEETRLILGVSPAQVTQHIKLVTELNEHTQLLIHTGKMTADDAFALLKIEDKDERAKVIEKVFQEDIQLGDTEESLGEVELDVETPKGQESSKSKTVREAVRDSGGKLTVRLSELKKYLKEAIEEEGPGSNKGEVEIKRSLLSYLDGELTGKQLDNRFNKYCKEKGV